MESEPIEYEISSLTEFFTLHQMKNAISLKVSKQVWNIYYLPDGKVNAYLLQSNEDFKVLKKYAGATDSSTIYFTYIENPQLSPFNDCIIIEETGIAQYSSLRVGDKLDKEWVIRVEKQLTDVYLVCVEGEFQGFSSPGVHLNSQTYSFSLSIPIQGPQRWSSSFWRVFAPNYYFGPLLWIELKIIT